MPRRYTSFKMSQVAYLREHYDDKTPAELANYFGITVRQVYELARRHGIKRRAPNGRPEWR